MTIWKALARQRISKCVYVLTKHGMLDDDCQYQTFGPTSLCAAQQPNFLGALDNITRTQENSKSNTGSLDSWHLPSIGKKENDKSIRHDFTSKDRYRTIDIHIHTTYTEA